MNAAKLFKIIGSVLLALFLAFGWHLTGYLKDLEKVSNTERLWILVVLGTVFVFQQIYLAVPKPVPHDEIEKRKALIQFYLRSDTPLITRSCKRFSGRVRWSMRLCVYMSCCRRIELLVYLVRF